MTEKERKINEANDHVMDIFMNGRPVWVDVKPAGEVIPGMTPNMILLAGPPLPVDQIPDAVRTSICGAIQFEHLSATKEDAWKLVEDGKVVLKPAQDYNCACGAAMATSASMPVNVVKDMTFGGVGFCAPHPGNGMRVLRWGVYDEQVEKDMEWMRDVFAPVQGEIVRKMGGVDVKSILAKTAGMGDENHCRQFAATMYLNLQMLNVLVDMDVPEKSKITHTLIENERFFLHVMMAGACSIIASARNVPYSTVMVGMGGNGVNFGLKFSGTGDEWFTVPAPKLEGMYLNPKYTSDDVLPYLGDSCVTEVYGLGGLSAIQGPAFVALSGHGLQEAKKRTNDARAICLGEHKFNPTPWDDMHGSPCGVDMRKVVALGIVPTSHGGATHIKGTQGLAGSCPFPMDCFRQGLVAFAQKINEEG